VGLSSGAAIEPSQRTTHFPACKLIRKFCSAFEDRYSGWSVDLKSDCASSTCQRYLLGEIPAAVAIT